VSIQECCLQDLRKQTWVTCSFVSKCSATFLDFFDQDFFGGSARNVGNVVPHARNFNPSNPSPEPGVLELGVAVNNIRHVVICGHSDCKAMNLLHSLREDAASIKLNELSHSPIKAWLLK